MRYYIIAGEASGDLHGSNLIRGLKSEDPDAEFRLWGGDLMLGAALRSGGSSLPETSAPQTPPEGPLPLTMPRVARFPEGTATGPQTPPEGPLPLTMPRVARFPEGTATGPQTPPEGQTPLVRHYKAGAVMGLTDVVAKAGQLLGNIKFCKSDMLKWKPDVVVLIDYPGFNMKIAEFCHKKGIKVFYYIAPKTWASREGRNRKLKAWVDKLFIVFPFEVPYFSERDIPFEYKGNPLVDAIDSHEYSRPVEGRYVAMLAGSRKGEISRMMPILMEVASRMHSKPEYADCRFVIAGAPARSEEDYRPYISDSLAPYVSVMFGRTYDILKFAQAAIINSGTASLEAALIGTPQVVCWSTSRFTAFVARNILRVLDHVKYISLGNLCVDRLVFKELIQEDFTADKVTAELSELISDESRRSEMLAGYDEIRRSLGGSGASREVAKAMISSL